MVEGDTVMIVACRLCWWGMVRSLIVEGANVDAMEGEGKKALQVACRAADKELNSKDKDEDFFFLRPSYDPQRVDSAVRSTVSGALKDLLKKTSDVADLKITSRQEIDDDSLIYFFSCHEFKELLLLSFSRGVDIDAVDRDRWTALMNSAGRARPAYMKILVKNGADVNRMNACHETALFAAIDRDNDVFPHAWPIEESFISSVHTVVEILLDWGADVNARSETGATVLY
uniref:Uncharacterized protein n=1 Tax=Chromera velia CCMP2878 TaxID=1169474 RepID=A0A0G4GWK3_9ALVE|eukprot:Cvel_5309.t1-p1 / transcript=Cvel_5309.t1 / gene=Cvel_5309 / organism=Chromera_velia_CCMP2878 / gene_product=hypothetical protein / transcript_product=hypothetical protein / location=Cvel_scaffold246:27430-28116(-) / protein_length=229 / sequence_SO=supercontig / SO=protein_coding / is_pseudo=false